MPTRKRPGAPKEAQSSAAVPPESPEYEDNEYGQLMEQVRTSTEQQMLYVPPKIQADPPEVPVDWTTIGPQELQRLYGAFSAFTLRAGYLEKVEASKATVCRNACEEIFQALFAMLTVGKDSSVNHVKAQVEQDPDLKRWRKRQHKHEAFAASYKADREGYTRMVDSLSRLHTMRESEFNQAGTLPERRK